MSQENYKNRYRVTPAVFVVITNDKGQVLLHRRFNTTYMDGYYDFPSGHLEAGEQLQDSAARETMEEVGLTVKPADLELIHVNQNDAQDYPYMNFIFRAPSWQGKPRICEPEKCDDIGFFALDNLPKVTPQVRTALKQLSSKTVTFSYFTTKTFEALLKS
jgi:8-oxo-dGTP diphosphatase